MGKSASPLSIDFLYDFKSKIIKIDTVLHLRVVTNKIKTLIVNKIPFNIYLIRSYLL